MGPYAGVDFINVTPDSTPTHLALETLCGYARVDLISQSGTFDLASVSVEDFPMKL
jgi:hypothetical protein